MAKVLRSLLSTVNNNLASFNNIIHDSADTAEKITEHIKSGASGIMTAKGVKDCVVEYQWNNKVCLTVSAIGTASNISNCICRNVPGLKKFAPINIYVSLGYKYFVYQC